jgi:hypothetical protein
MAAAVLVRMAVGAAQQRTDGARPQKGIKGIGTAGKFPGAMQGNIGRNAVHGNGSLI